MEAELVSDIWTIAQVILIDLALGGDNSIVIGMAAKNLPPKLQKKAIILRYHRGYRLAIPLGGSRRLALANSLLKNHWRALVGTHWHSSYWR